MTATNTTGGTSADIINRHDRFLSLNYPRYDVAMVRGEGEMLYDADGKSYIDLFAGFGAGILGHCHPELVETIREQAGKLWHVGNLLHTEPQTWLAEAIARHGFGGRTFFSHSGADANESALKLARLYGQAKPGSAGQRYKIISAIDSFHGRSFGTMPATGSPKVREGFGPMLPGYANVAYNDITAIEREIDDQTVAILVEPIQGEGGINVPDDDYLTHLRELCNRHDLLLILDEVWTGCGRTGRFFGYQHWPVTPDIMTMGKGIGGGLPVGAMCASPELAELFDARKQGGVKHATTLGGNCIAMATGAKIFEIIDRDKLTARSTTLGEQAMTRLREFARQTGLVSEVRGKGLFIGIALNMNTPEKTFNNAGDIVNKCMERGVLINGTKNHILRLAPALVIGQQRLDQAMDVLEDVIKG